MFHMPDSYYDPPDYEYTDAQMDAIEDGRWDEDKMSWEEFLEECYGE